MFYLLITVTLTGKCLLGQVGVSRLHDGFRLTKQNNLTMHVATLSAGTKYII